MRILSWNIQGGKKLHAIAELIYLKNKFCPDISFIIETRTNNQNSCRIFKSMRFDHTLIIDLVNHSGGLWIGWNSDKLVVETYTTTHRCAHLNVLYRPNNTRYSITRVYCPAQESEKESFWQYLQDYFISLPNPWLLVGDLNEMLLTTDKHGGRPLSPLNYNVSQIY